MGLTQCKTPSCPDTGSVPITAEPIVYPCVRGGREHFVVVLGSSLYGLRDWCAGKHWKAAERADVLGLL